MQENTLSAVEEVPFWRRLYVRIWLAVVMMVAVLTLLVGWVWRVTADPPLREMVVRNQDGDIVGRGRVRRPAMPEPLLNPASAPATPAQPPVMLRPGPEFVLQMDDGERYFVQLPPPKHDQRSLWGRWPLGFVWTLALVGLAVAIATYPIVRRLTHRLERLRSGVERWGEGNLGLRVEVSGNDEVTTLAERFNQAAQSIETLVGSHTHLLEQQKSLLEAQKSLLANASHELRSPLARIRMGVELLADTTATAWRQELSRSIAELDQLIDEILLASRLDAQEADLGTVEQVDLVGLAAEECARVEAVLEVQAEADDAVGELQVRGVNKLLRRLIRNLLENARRYGAGEVTVTLRRVSNRVQLSVCDSGPGVPPALRERIFEPFYRLPGASERDGGVGLGLSLVKAIALRHRGSVICKGAEGSGACFVVELPMA